MKDDKMWDDRYERELYAEQKAASRRARNVVINIAMIAALILLGRFTYHFSYAVFNQQPMTSEVRAKEVEITVEEGMSARQIGKLLEKKGLVESSLTFLLQEQLSDYRGKLQPGTYTLNTAQTPDEIMAVMAAAGEEGES